MEIKVTVSGPDGRQIDNVWNVRDQGDLTRAVGEAIKFYHEAHPDSPPFEHSIKVEHA